MRWLNKSNDETQPGEMQSDDEFDDIPLDPMDLRRSRANARDAQIARRNEMRQLAASLVASLQNAAATYIADANESGTHEDVAFAAELAEMVSNMAADCSPMSPQRLMF